MMWALLLSSLGASLLNYGVAMHDGVLGSSVNTFLEENFDHEKSGTDYIVIPSESAIDEFENPELQYTHWNGEHDDGATDLTSSDPSKARCSTWGSGNILTLDNDMYFFSGTCNYIFVRVCQNTPPEIFNVQYQRGDNGTMKTITILIGPLNIIVQGQKITINSQRVAIPYSNNGIQIMKHGSQTALIVKQQDLELSVLWDQYSLSVDVDRKYAKQTCGLCGNFNGEHADEFKEEGGKLLFPYQYAVTQQMDGPGVTCPFQMSETKVPEHLRFDTNCRELLDQVSTSCSVPKENFITPCERDLYNCRTPGMPNCACSTLSQYSSQCANIMQPVNNWRTKSFCPIGACPANQVYNESGLPCIATCTNPHYTCPANQPGVYGCFCPEGTVLDDVSDTGKCVPVDECPCEINGQIFFQNETSTTPCQTCQCLMGQWLCSKEICPGRCSIEGGSEISSFDNKQFRFHGVCEYVLLSSSQMPHNGTLTAKFESCGVSSSETCLASLTYVTIGDKLEPLETIVISNQDHIVVNAEIRALPYITDGLILVRASSTHLILYSNFGLEVVVQRFPVFDVYVTVQPNFAGTTRGLCGNFNKDTNDDFMSSCGIPEGSVTVFIDSWRASPNPHLCTPAQNKDINPCSMSVSNELFAETHCSILLKTNTVFQRCHSMVDPEPFYKRCVYVGCNYQETFAFICDSLGSYARACAAKGIVLTNWRASTNCSIPCTGNQTFSYDTEACGRTCLSLSNKQYECYAPDVPLDGCNCPSGQYLDHMSNCVPSSQCPCYLPDNAILLPNHKSTVDGLTCYCMNGKLNCFGKPAQDLGVCPSPKELKICGNGLQKWGAACAPSCQMKATGIRCIPTRCETGCVCPSGLYEDLDGDCVTGDTCSCEYGGHIYRTGQSMQKDCQNCLCQGGQWQCTENLKCASTCVLYGEGHVVTFDGQQFVFDGNCEYSLVTDGCGVNNSLSSFKIVTENVVCGRLGVTCSRSIRITLGATVLHLMDRNYTITPNVHSPNLKVTTNNLFMTFDITIPNKFIISLLWNKNMNVFIKLFKLGQDAICGLCGNYNGNQKDDYETRSKYIAPNMLGFVNSWKENPSCGDVNLVVDPCSQNPYRGAWAQKNCAVINSKVFEPCHSLEYQGPYYEACLHDACGCDSGGDCECLCDAIAVYAKKCLEKGVCIDWRRPDFCPVFCDYQNTHVQAVNDYVYAQENCTWHYRPCQCPFTPHNYPLSNNEGCYNCSQNEYYSPDEGKCIPCEPLSTTTTVPSTTIVTSSIVTSQKPESTITSTTSTSITPVTPTTSSTEITHTKTKTTYSETTETVSASTKIVSTSKTPITSPTTSTTTSPTTSTTPTTTVTTPTTTSTTTTSTPTPPMITSTPTTTSTTTTTSQTPTTPQTTTVTPTTTSTTTTTTPLTTTTTPVTSTTEVETTYSETTPTKTVPPSTETRPTETVSTSQIPTTKSTTTATTSSSTTTSTTPTTTSTPTSTTTLTPTTTSTQTTSTTITTSPQTTTTPSTTATKTTKSTTPTTTVTPTTEVSSTEVSPTETRSTPTESTPIETTSESTTTMTTTTVKTPSTSTPSTSVSPTSETTKNQTTPRKPVTGKHQPTATATTAPCVTPPPQECRVHEYTKNITKDGCSREVTLTTCEGMCSSQSWYDDTFQIVKGRCGCCIPDTDNIKTKAIMLNCPDDTKEVIVDIKIFTSCQCDYQVCTHN